MFKILKGLKIYFSICVVVLFFSRCDDFIEKDISKEKVVLIVPGDSITTKLNEINFFWELMEGNGITYSFQLVSPSFDQAQLLVMDSLTTKTQISMELVPGAYQWRVRAEGYSYRSPYTTRTFTIEPEVENETEEIEEE